MMMSSRTASPKTPVWSPEAQRVGWVLSARILGEADPGLKLVGGADARDGSREGDTGQRGGRGAARSVLRKSRTTNKRSREMGRSFRDRPSSRFSEMKELGHQKPAAAELGGLLVLLTLRPDQQSSFFAVGCLASAALFIAPTVPGDAGCCPPARFFAAGSVLLDCAVWPPDPC